MGAKNKKTATVNPALSEYLSRILFYLLITATLAVGCYHELYSSSFLILIPYSLLYPHFVKLLTDYFAGKNDNFCLLRQLIDAAHLGVFLVIIGFMPIPTMAAIVMLSFGTLVNSGIQTTLYSFIMLLLASIGGWFLLNNPLLVTDSLYTSLAAMLVLFIYLSTYAYCLYFQGVNLHRAKSELRREQEKAAHLARSLAKYLSPQVWQTIFTGKRGVRLETQRKKLTVFFSDIKGFTELSEELEAEALTDLLNNYLNEMSKIALKYGGTIDKFIGDSVMIFFGDPSSQGAKKDALAAVSMAIEMRKHMKVLRQQWRAQGIDKPLEIRMGINTGYCTVGNFGAETRMDYTIVGREVNLASRLENLADSNEILISTETYSLTKDIIMAKDKGQIQVKGFTRPVQIFQVVDHRRDLGETRSFVEHELPGFSMYLDTNNLQSLDKDQIIKALDEAAERIKDTL